MSINQTNTIPAGFEFLMSTGFLFYSPRSSREIIIVLFEKWLVFFKLMGTP